MSALNDFLLAFLNFSVFLIMQSVTYFRLDSSWESSTF